MRGKNDRSSTSLTIEIGAKHCCLYCCQQGILCLYHLCHVKRLSCDCCFLFDMYLNEPGSMCKSCATSFFSLKMNHSGAFLSQYCTNKAVFSDRGEDLVGFTDVRFRYLCSCICWMMFGLILIWLTIVHFLGWADTCCSFEGHWTEHCSLKEELTSLCDRNPQSRFLMFSIGLINGWGAERCITGDLAFICQIVQIRMFGTSRFQFGTTWKFLFIPWTELFSSLRPWSLLQLCWSRTGVRLEEWGFLRECKIAEAPGV